MFSEHTVGTFGITDLLEKLDLRRFLASQPKLPFKVFEVTYFQTCALSFDSFQGCQV